MLQAAPAATPWRAAHTRRLPGIQPVDGADWLTLDDAYAGQLAARERLLDTRSDAVLAQTGAGQHPAREALASVLELLRQRPGFRVESQAVTCPDGRRVALEGCPLRVLGRLIQEDLCLLVKPDRGAEHLLAGAVLCFPSGWTLAEKIGRPLVAIHGPVPDYDRNIAARVQRLCDGVRAGHPVWRANAHLYDSSDLFAPRRETDPVRPQLKREFLRSERQTLVRLPETDAVLFAIHVSVVPLSALAEADRAALLSP